MEEVFFNEGLNGQVDWETSDVAGEVSLVPSSSENESDLFIVQIDIHSRLKTLKHILTQKLGITLSHYELWLQDVVQLNEETTLSEQCIQGEGMVQVNLELKSVENTDRINILDVLKPPAEDSQDTSVSVETQEENSLYTLQENTTTKQHTSEPVCQSEPSVKEELLRNTKVNGSQNVGIVSETGVSASSCSKSTTVLPIKSLNGNPRQPTGEIITRWVMDSNFRKDQDRLKIPLDPVLWTQAQVQHWIVWAKNQFDLKEVNASQWLTIDGPALCQMSHSEFIEKIPNDPNDLFWTHLELLRKCKFVGQLHTLLHKNLVSSQEMRFKRVIVSGVIQKPMPYLQYVTTPLKGVKQDALKIQQTVSKPVPNLTKVVQSEANGNAAGIQANRTGNSGQVQLWQFLLELLTDKNFRDAISWLGTGGEFKLNNPEMVAQLWGERKNKPHMNYEKLSRALRYYYDGDMICKVNGKRFVYKFVCDLKQLLGYSADELNKLVIECAQRSNAKRATSSIL